MRRRCFLAGTAVALAPGSLAGQTRRRIGILMGNRAQGAMSSAYAAGLTSGLAALGWREGSNLILDWRWAGGDPALFEQYADELVALHPDALLAEGSPSVLALRRATRSVPIVFTIVTDPLAQGFVESLAQPGGNVTGFTDYDPSMAGKWMAFLSDVRPSVTHAGVAFNPATAPFANDMFVAVDQAAPAYSVVARKTPWTNDREIRDTMAELARERHGGVVILSDLFNIVHRGTIIAAAAEHRVPAIYFNRSFVLGGGLMSYGVDYVDQFRRAAGYFDRLFKGARAADLPVQQPDKFELVVNLGTAKALGITLSTTLVAAADDVIE